jgi:glyoxylase-like metal-dependent hydrolase (beta-lactamase superfamily II)
MHILQTGTVAIKSVQRQGKPTGMPIMNVILDKNWTEPLPIFAFVIEHPEGLIVVDTGETARAATPGYFPWWHPYYRFGVREWVQSQEEIGPQMRAIGLNPNDVRWVLLTHMHTDHAGGLAHFPKAEHVLSQREFSDTRGFGGQVQGYLPQRWPEWFKPTLFEATQDAIGPFAASHPITRAGDVRMIPTPGHTPGHHSVLVSTPEQNYFIAGDVSYTQDLMLAQQIDGVTQDQATAKQTLAYVSQFVRATPTIYLPAHDPESLDRLTNRLVVSPAQA